MRFKNDRTPMLAAIWVAFFAISFVNGFTTPTISSQKKLPTSLRQANDDDDDDGVKDFGMDTASLSSIATATSRREMIAKSTALASVSFLPALLGSPRISSAAVGSLPELVNSNAYVQGLTINVADSVQQKQMVDFLVDGFSFEVLRQRNQDTIEETWLGFGPEQLSVPDDFELPVSSFSKYGGHASINVRYDYGSKAPLYRQGDDAPGNNIAYLQLGVPGYRISQMVANAGNILDAYGLVNVVSPSGLPIRGIVGISPDPIMFVAVNCKNVQESKEFYENLGFVEQEVPYSRPSKGTTMFEPAPPKGSCYMSPSPTSMGVLLLPGKKKKTITANPAVNSLNIVYNPSSSETSSGEDKEIRVKDPSGVTVNFQSEAAFSNIEKKTR